MKADIYEGFRCMSVHKTSVEFENDLLCWRDHADEIMFQMEEYKFRVFIILVVLKYLNLQNFFNLFFVLFYVA